MARFSTRTRALGTHWWNPPYLVPFVEVIRTGDTSDDAIVRTFALLKSVGKAPVEVRKDGPGFVGNRLQHALWREAIALVVEGVCDAKTVDDVVKSSFGARLAVLGPLENADLVGHRSDPRHSQLRLSGPRPRNDALALSRCAGRRKGKLGFKSGGGFRDWTKERAGRAARAN